MKRIEINENRLDTLNDIVLRLEKDLDEFQRLSKVYKELNKYYGSKSWFSDKEKYESGKIENIKAGVLSEDAVYDLDTNISELLIEMKEVIELYSNK